jgi:lipoprotein NlpD
MSGMQFVFALVCVCLLAGLGGCAGRTYYSDVPEPVSPSASAPVAAARTADSYVVKPGDTLYSLSFSQGTDWRELAALNGISPPYTIYPGQLLRLVATAPLPRQTVEAPTARATAAPDVGLPLSQGRKPATPVAPAVTAPVPAATTAAVAAKHPPGVAISAPPSKATPPRPGAWQWPSAGRMILGFAGGAQPHKGVDIEGKPGDPVLAANSGSVVYAGNGVRGYGNLLIVKHDATYLSAYAHNSRLLVKEGDVVSGGQKIAEVGDSGTDRYKLHFEVRKQGNPIDPLTILPRR